MNMPNNEAWLVNRAREKCGRKTLFSKELSVVRQELRERRKSLIGSHISVRELISAGSPSAKDNVIELSSYLASRTVPFWRIYAEEAETFCFRFYKLALCAIASGKVGRESIDDVLQFAECLVRNRRAFVIAMKELLPSDMIGEMYDFTEAYGEEFYAPVFEDAVLGGMCVLLGVLTDPLTGSAQKEDKED